MERGTKINKRDKMKPINPNELRIGNLLKINDLFVTVNRIEKDKFWATHKELWFFQGEECSPVLLTEEILLKCGFEKDKDGVFKRGDCLFWIDKSASYDFGTIQIALDYSPIINSPCKYLHQLQNLLFTLTGKELEINF